MDIEKNKLIPANEALKHMLEEYTALVNIFIKKEVNEIRKDVENLIHVLNTSKMD
jgi:hypothetical protein